MFGTNENIEEQSLDESSVTERPLGGTVPKEREEAYRKLSAERDELFDRLARTQAEFENYRKRASREQADYREYALADVAKSLLPVLDSFNLALRSETTDQDSELRKGVELIRRQLEEALGRMGVKRIAAVGEPFDPRVHEALEVVETGEAEDNSIVAELQPGYKLKDRLLRPAMVRVARNHK